MAMWWTRTVRKGRRYSRDASATPSLSLLGRCRSLSLVLKDWEGCRKTDSLESRPETLTSGIRRAGRRTLVPGHRAYQYHEAEGDLDHHRRCATRPHCRWAARWSRRHTKPHRPLPGSSKPTVRRTERSVSRYPALSDRRSGRVAWWRRSRPKEGTLAVTPG